MTERTNVPRQVVAGLIFVVLLACAANYYFELHVFGRFDKLALILSIAVGVALVHVFGPSMPRTRPTFSWASFLAVAAAVLGVSATIVWRNYHKPNSDGAGDLLFLVIPVTAVIFLAYRWRVLRRELSDNAFSDEEFHANPGQYMMGPLRQQLLWMLLAVALLIVLSFVASE